MILPFGRRHLSPHVDHWTALERRLLHRELVPRQAVE